MLKKQGFLTLTGIFSSIHEEEYPDIYVIYLNFALFEITRQVDKVSLGYEHK